MTTSDTRSMLQGAIFDILYEIPNVPMGHRVKAAARIVELLGLSEDAVLSLSRYGAALDEGDSGPTATMEVDNAMGKFVALQDVLALCNKDTPLVQGIHGLPRLPTPASGERTYTGHGNYEETPYFTEQQVLQVQQQAYHLGISKARQEFGVDVRDTPAEGSVHGN